MNDNKKCFNDDGRHDFWANFLYETLLRACGNRRALNGSGKTIGVAFTIELKRTTKSEHS